MLLIDDGVAGTTEQKVRRVIEAQLVEAILAGVHLVVVKCEERFAEPGSLLVLATRCYGFESIVIV